MKISSYNSQKISVLNMVLIFLVVLIHSYYSSAEGMPVASAIQIFTGTNGIARVAVPMFFFLSGTLFFNGVQKVEDCISKIGKRVRSLLIPYVLWNIIFVLWYVVLQNLPGIGSMVNIDMLNIIFGGSIYNGIKELLWTPAAFHLWFLRDLLFIVLISPVLYYLIKYTKWLAPLLLLGAMVLLVQSGIFTAIDYELNRIDGISFFCIGGCISMFASLESLDRCLSKPLVAIAVIVFFGNAVWQIFGTDFNVWYNFLTALCGCIVVWKGYDWFISKITSNLSSLNFAIGYSFFIYLFHEPTLNIMKKIGLRVLGEHEWTFILLYFANPILMCIIAIMVAKIWQRYTPRIYRIFTGGR